jgi:ribosomal protein S18 acetylase RimI-like enzyme
MPAVREAGMPGEIPLVQELFREYEAGIGVDLCFQGFNQELATLPGRYARPAGGIWLATVGEAVAGCVALRALDAQMCEVKRLYVRPAFRGQGLGRQLTEQVLKAASAAGYQRVCLDALPQFTSALAMYRSLGFAPIDPYCHNPVPGALFLGRALPFTQAGSETPLRPSSDPDGPRRHS